MICFGCPVRLKCDEYRRETDSRYGIWGGNQYNDSE